jgi:hypothetical protein
MRQKMNEKHHISSQFITFASKFGIPSFRGAGNCPILGMGLFGKMLLKRHKPLRMERKIQPNHLCLQQSAPLIGAVSRRDSPSVSDGANATIDRK